MKIREISVEVAKKLDLSMNCLTFSDYEGVEQYLREALKAMFRMEKELGTVEGLEDMVRFLEKNLNMSSKDDKILSTAIITGAAIHTKLIMAAKKEGKYDV